MKDTILEWTEALRSGKYKQGKRFLRTGDSFCCLGVAGDLVGDKNLVGSMFFTLEHMAPKYFGLSHRGFVCNNVDILDAELDRANKPSFYGLPEGVTNITADVLNDSIGLSFEEIAYLIEEEYARELGLL